MSRCQAVIKSGSRSGRKCRRLNCPYHIIDKVNDMVDEEKELDSLHPQDENDNLKQTTLPILEAVVVKEEIPILEAVVVKEEIPILEVVVKEEIPILEAVPILEEVVVKEEIPILEEVVVKEEIPILEAVPILEEVVVQEEIPIMEHVKSIEDEVPIVEVGDEKEDEFVEITENDCKEKIDVLVIDTETIGLPPHKSVPMGSPDWERCRVIQVAWKKLVSGVTRTYIIRPDDFEVKMTSVHGITQEEAEEKGVPMRTVLRQLAEDLKTVETVVAHNINFDYQVISYEFFRAKIRSEWESVNRECTMHLAKKTGLCEGPIRLGLLYELCFGKMPEENLHRADVDMEVCAKIYEFLREKMRNKIYFNVNYKDKEVFKFFGGLWDPVERKWYTYECHRFLCYLDKWFSR